MGWHLEGQDKKKDKDSSKYCRNLDLIRLYKKAKDENNLELAEKYKVKIIEENKILIKTLANRFAMTYSYLNIDPQDLYQEGVLGLLISIDKYKLPEYQTGTRPAGLITYATWLIKSKMFKYIEKELNNNSILTYNNDLTYSDKWEETNHLNLTSILYILSALLTQQEFLIIVHLYQLYGFKQQAPASDYFVYTFLCMTRQEYNILKTSAMLKLRKAAEEGLIAYEDFLDNSDVF